MYLHEVAALLSTVLTTVCFRYPLVVNSNTELLNVLFFSYTHMGGVHIPLPRSTPRTILLCDNIQRNQNHHSVNVW